MKAGKAKIISKENFQILNRIHKASGLSDFWLGGSTTYRDIAVDMGFDFKHNDYDLAVMGSFKKLNDTIKLLKEKNFTITKKRPYYLKLNKAFQIMAMKGDVVLDIAIVKDISHLGHFNWESIFWHFPSGKIYDPYNGLDALKEKKLLPIILVTEENPFILASRFAKLCACFEVDFIKNKQLFYFAENLSKEITKWDGENFFHGEYAKGHGYFNMLQAILMAPKRIQFISDLRKTELLEAMFPEISKDISLKSDTVKKIEKAKNVRGIVIALESILKESPKMLKKFKKRLEIISDRLEKEKNQK